MKKTLLLFSCIFSFFGLLASFWLAYLYMPPTPSLETAKILEEHIQGEAFSAQLGTLSSYNVDDYRESVLHPNHPLYPLYLWDRNQELAHNSLLAAHTFIGELISFGKELSSLQWEWRLWRHDQLVREAFQATSLITDIQQRDNERLKIWTYTLKNHERVADFLKGTSLTEQEKNKLLSLSDSTLLFLQSQLPLGITQQDTYTSFYPNQVVALRQYGTYDFSVTVATPSSLTSTFSATLASSRILFKKTRGLQNFDVYTAHAIDIVHKDDVLTLEIPAKSWQHTGTPPRVSISKISTPPGLTPKSKIEKISPSIYRVVLSGFPQLTTSKALASLGNGWKVEKLEKDTESERSVIVSYRPTTIAKYSMIILAFVLFVSFILLLTSKHHQKMRISTQMQRVARNYVEKILNFSSERLKDARFIFLLLGFTLLIIDLLIIPFDLEFFTAVTLTLLFLSFIGYRIHSAFSFSLAGLLLLFIPLALATNAQLIAQKLGQWCMLFMVSGTLEEGLCILLGYEFSKDWHKVKSESKEDVQKLLQFGTRCLRYVYNFFSAIALSPADTFLEKMFKEQYRQIQRTSYTASSGIFRQLYDVLKKILFVLFFFIKAIVFVVIMIIKGIWNVAYFISEHIIEVTIALFTMGLFFQIGQQIIYFTHYFEVAVMKRYMQFTLVPVWLIGLAIFICGLFFIRFYAKKWKECLLITIAILNISTNIQFKRVTKALQDNPVITRVSRTNASFWTELRIRGHNFGNAQFKGAGVFIQGELHRVLKWQNDEIIITIDPLKSRSGQLWIVNGDQKKSNSVEFVYTQK